MASQVPVFGVFGTGGFGREVVEIAWQNCQARYGEGQFRLVLLEDAPARRTVNQWPVLSLEEFAREPAASRFFNVAIADRYIRERTVKRCLEAGLQPFSVRSALADVAASASIGVGAVLCQFCVVSVNSTIGDFFHLNHHSYVSHDCRLGRFVTFAPAAHCNGTIDIGDYAYIGSGAVIRQSTGTQRVSIGANATVGMGAVVLNSVPAGATVVGNPARILAP